MKNSYFDEIKEEFARNRRVKRKDFSSFLVKDAATYNLRECSERAALKARNSIVRPNALQKFKSNVPARDHYKATKRSLDDILGEHYDKRDLKSWKKKSSQATNQMAANILNLKRRLLKI